MGVTTKRVIAQDQFNEINGCFYEDLISFGHIPVSASILYEKHRETKASDHAIDLGILSDVITCHGTPRVRRYSKVYEKSPLLHVSFTNKDMWDKAINKICSSWGREAMVKSLTTYNNKTGQTVKWIRARTENGVGKNQLVIESIDGDSYRICSYAKQQEAADEMWGDTCKYVRETIETERAACKMGTH